MCNGKFGVVFTVDLPHGSTKESCKRQEERRSCWWDATRGTDGWSVRRAPLICQRRSFSKRAGERIMAPFTSTHKHTHTRMARATAASRFCSPQGRFQDFLKWGVTGGTGNKAHTRVFIINLNTLGLVCFSASCQRFIRCKEVLHTHLNIDYLVLDNCCVKWEIYLKSNIYSSKPSNPT